MEGEVRGREGERYRVQSLGYGLCVATFLCCPADYLQHFFSVPVRVRVCVCVRVHASKIGSQKCGEKKRECIRHGERVSEM